MEPVLLIEEIEYPQNKRHILKKTKNVLPFTTHSASYIQNNFHVVISELARIVTKFRLNKKELDLINYSYYEKANKISQYIADSNNIDFQNEENKIDFTRFIDAYLFQNGQFNIIHSYLYNFIGESGKNQPVIKNIAEFIYSVFIEDDEELQSIFKNKKTDDILTKLIINVIEPLVIEKESTSDIVHYSNLFPNLTKLFKKDLKFLMKHRDYFLNNFELFVHFYTFMYVLQCIVQFEKFENGDYENATPLYFALDWEAINKKRPVADYSKGYKFIKERAGRLFAHQHVLQQLSHNFLNRNALVGEKEVLGYSTLIEYISSNGPEYEKQFKEDLKKWINEYSRIFDIEPPPQLKDTIGGLLEQLFNQVSSKMHVDAQYNYGKSVEYLGAGVFLKPRGSLGNLLNMSHELLMLLTTVIVKDQRMPLKTLFGEFEKRGIAFDRQSKEEIISLFNSQNILDKKSDSGDAQYVKPIL